MVDIVDLRNLVAEAEGTTDERAAQKTLLPATTFLLVTVGIYSLVSLSPK
jgi:hypothetical protein